MCQEQHPHDAGEAAGSAVMMMKGSSRLEIDHINRYTSTIAPAVQRAGRRMKHSWFAPAATKTWVPRGRSCFEAVMILFTCVDMKRDRPLHGAVDVDHRHGVVVADHPGSGAAVEERHIGKHLRSGAPVGRSGVAARS